MTAKAPALPNRLVPFSDGFKAFIPTGWADPPQPVPPRDQAAAFTEARRGAIQDQFGADRLVIPAGGYQVRSNDCDFRFRPHSAFAWLTGLGEDVEPDAVLVIEDHQAVLYYHTPVAPTDPEFYGSARYGQMWVGARLSQDHLSARTGLEVRDSADLAPALAARLIHPEGQIRVLPGVDEGVEALVTALRPAQPGLDQELQVALSEARLIKDAYEIAQLDLACAATLVGFEAVIADLDQAVRAGRGERWVEGVFGLHARHLGNAVGYDTIAAAGEHACTLHWIRNDGPVLPGQLLLLDAGVEVNSLYTADVTRTLPVSGRFTDAQRQVYDAALAAQQAGIDAARPGAGFMDVHQAAGRVIAQHLADWGMLPVSVEESLSEQGGQHRRWMVHGTSHHLGLDVHDCAQARSEHYRQATLRPGMVITVEPGLYLKSTDQLVPEALRGIGVRIEDDIVITEDGCRVLSQGFPRSPEAVEAWMAEVQARAAA